MKREIKNELTEIIKATDIKELLDYTNEEYRLYDPGLYLYNLMSNYSFEKKFSDEFIELVYTTLIAWNMNQRKAKLSKFDLFKKSLLDNKNTIQSLEKYRIEELESSDIIEKPIRSLFEKLDLVDKGNPQLVTFSKTLHFFLPNLLMPIDRAYTLTFFYNNHNFSGADVDKQITIYLSVFEQFRQFAKTHRDNDAFKEHEKRWNKNLPKMIDNLIIGYIQTKMKIYAIWSGDAYENEPRCYVEAKDIDNLVKIMSERNRKQEPYKMFPGWCPVEISRKEMAQILSRFNENDIELVDENKRSAFILFAKMQLDDASIIEELKKYRLYKQKYSVNLTTNDIKDRT